MKIAASDYDGTLLRQGKIHPEDVRAITDWRRRGHKFGLATGRDLSMLITELRANGLPFDFLVCSTGAALYDHQGRPVLVEALPAELVEELLKHPALGRRLHLALSQNEITYVQSRSDQPSWLRGLSSRFLVDIDDDNRFSAVEDVHQITLEFARPDEARACLAALMGTFGEIMEYHFTEGVCIQLTRPRIDKAVTLTRLAELMGWPEGDLVVAGDSENDIPMFRRFKGYAMKSSPPELKALAYQVVGSPAEMLGDNSAAA